MTTYQTKAGEIAFPIVPRDAESFNIYTDQISGRQYMMYTYLKDGMSDADQTPLLPEGSWEIVGPIFWETYSTESNPLGGGRELKFGFDPEPLLEKQELELTYYELVDKYPQVGTTDKFAAFISLIESKEEILFSNPIRPIEKPIMKTVFEMDMYDFDKYRADVEHYNKYQLNETRLVKKEEQIIVLKKGKTA